jgi:hypothetical protein
MDDRQRTTSIDSPDAIRDAFNQASNVPRLVTLLSPTCETCLRGAQAVSSLLERDQRFRVQVVMIWMRGEPEDSLLEANRQASLHPDGRVSHFWDRRDLIGEMVAELLGRPGLIAWDIYLGYVAGTTWIETLPMPAAWVHQMGDPSWADDDHQCDPDSFADELRTVVAAIHT